MHSVQCTMCNSRFENYLKFIEHIGTRLKTHTCKDKNVHNSVPFSLNDDMEVDI